MYTKQGQTGLNWPQPKQGQTGLNWPQPKLDADVMH